VYFQVTDSQVHALVGCRTHQGADTLQYYKCQVCGSKGTARWNTPLYDLKTAAHEVARVMTARSEGVDVAAASRIFAHDERTVQRWLARGAHHAERWHARLLRNGVCRHLQWDELVTKLRGVKERVGVWVALDAHTKLILVIRCGGRTRVDAQWFVHEVWSQLAPGAPPVFTTAGLQQSYDALTAPFGHWVSEAGKRWPAWPVDPRLWYGQLHKIKSGRVNLTLREPIASLSRRTWSLAQNEHRLWMPIEWGRAHYHFCRYHEALRVLATRSGHRYRSRTLAMAAGLARRRWRVSDLLLLPLPPA